MAPSRDERPWDDARDAHAEDQLDEAFESHQPEPFAGADAEPPQPQASRAVDAPRPWEDRPRPARPAEPSGGPRQGGFDRQRPGGFDGPRGGGRPGMDRRGPRPYVPLRPAVAADPSLALAPDEELVAGRRPVEEAFVARRESKRLYVVPQRRQALEKLVLHATSLRIPVIEVEGGTLTAICGFDGHQGIALVVAERRWASPEEILAVAATRAEPPLVLVLDSLEDPQNVGTLLRTAEASGVHGAVFPTRHQAPLTPSAVKASAGAVEHLALSPVDDLPGTLADLRAHGLRIVGADGDAPLTAREADLRGPIAIVVGSEGKGLGPVIRRRCDLLVRIPMHGKIESLNAAVAGSILLYEAAAQRRLPDPGPRPEHRDAALPPAGSTEPSGPAPQTAQAEAETAKAEVLVAESPAEARGDEPNDVQAKTAEAEALGVAPELAQPDPAVAESATAEPSDPSSAEAPAASGAAEPATAPLEPAVAAPDPAVESPAAAPDKVRSGSPATEPKPKATRTRKPKAAASPAAPPLDEDDLLPGGPSGPSGEV